MFSLQLNSRNALLLRECTSLGTAEQMSQTEEKSLLPGEQI